MFNHRVTGIWLHLVDYLLKNTNWNIYGLLRWSSKLDNIEHHLDLVNKKKRFFLLYGDLTDHISIRKALTQSHPDYVFHLAAESFPKMSFDSPLKFYETNIKGTHILLEEIKNLKNINPIIHVCSFRSLERFKKYYQLKKTALTRFSPYVQKLAQIEDILRLMVCTIMTRMFTLLVQDVVIILLNHLCKTNCND